MDGLSLRLLARWVRKYRAMERKVAQLETDLEAEWRQQDRLWSRVRDLEGQVVSLQGEL